MIASCASQSPLLKSPTEVHASVDRESIASTYELIRPYIRRTPIVEVEGSDFGLNGVRLIHKLELLQHSGSFKARGAFTNLLMRPVPPAGVVAASGGNHGVAVAFAAMKLKKPARIFVPEVASPAKMERIRGYGADLVVTGQLYADALAASEEWAAQSGAMVVHAYDQIETLLGQGTVGLEFEEQYPQLDTLLVAVGGGGLIGGIAAWYRLKNQNYRRGTRSRTHTHPRGAGGASSRCRGRRNRRRLASSEAGRRIDVPHRAGARQRCAAGF